MKPRLWRPTVMIITLLMTITYLFFNSTPVNSQVHLLVLHSLHTLEHMEPRLNSDLQLSQAGMPINPDNFDRSLSVMQQQLQGIKQLSAELPDKLSSIIQPPINKLEQALQNVTLLIPKFKSSVTLKQRSIDAILRHQEAEFLTVREQIIRHLLHHEDVHINDLSDRFRALKNRPDTQQAAWLKQLEQLLLQINDSTEILEQITAQTVAVHLDVLESSYIQTHNQIDERANTYRTLLYITSAGLLFYLMVLLVRLRINSIKLRESNRALGQEIKERKHAEKEQRIYMEQLSLSNKELDDFAYIASHDLKEPLRGIHNYAAFLSEDYADKIDSEGQQYLQTIQRLAQRMDQLIEDLRAYSRVGYMELALGDVDLYKPLNEVLESLEYVIKESNVEIRIPQRMPIVYCDRVRIKEIFQNLITNAIKYNDKEKKWIEIGFRLDSYEQSQRYDTRNPVQGVTFYVRDNGLGIQEKHIETIFRIFKRLHGRDQYGGGTGVGLTIVKKLIQRHNGRIWVESTYKAGSTFYFTLGKNPSENNTIDGIS